MDGDGDLDIVDVNEGRDLVWYENNNGSWVDQHEIFRNFLSKNEWFPSIWVKAADVDGDHDQDIVGAITNRQKTEIVLLDQVSAQEEYEIVSLFILPEKFWLRDFELVDIDLDGDLDILLIGTAPLQIENKGNDVWIPNEINFDGFVIGDVDADGIHDLITSLRHEGAIQVSWAPAGPDTWQNSTPVFEMEGRLIHAADIDSDHDVDLVFALPDPPNSVHWSKKENTNFKAPEVLVISASHRITLAGLADFTRDGNIDALLIEADDDMAYSQHRVVLFEQVYRGEPLDGPRPVADLGVIHQFDPRRIWLSDFEGDGDLDIFLGHYNGALYVYENKLTGDANDDGKVDFDDFLELSNNFGKNVDAIWSEGDFNSDRQVDFEDFLLLASEFHGAIPGRPKPDA